jgi:hypothetical protein
MIPKRKTQHITKYNKTTHFRKTKNFTREGIPQGQRMKWAGGI